MPGRPRNRLLTDLGSSRRAFTLLEVILALSIGLVLLAALYFSMALEVRQAQTGRDVVQRANIARNLFTKISIDINNHIGPVNPWLESKLGGSSSRASTTATPTTPTPPTTDTGNTDSATMDQAQTPPAMDGPPPFKILGSANSLSLAMTRYPRELKQGQTVSDLRRVTYWLVTEGAVTGLARREVTAITGDDPNADPFTLPDQGSYVIGPEVRELTFEYWNGTEWVTDWDGDSYGADGMTPQGPPAAIRITLQMMIRPARGDDPEQVQEFQHVVAIPTANIVQPDAGTTPMTGTTTP